MGTHGGQVLEEILLAYLLLDLLVGNSKDLCQAIKVLFRGASLDEDFLGEQLGDDATHGPHVNSRGVVGGVLEVEFWRPVVASGHKLCEAVVRVDPISLHIGLSEVRYLDIPVLVDQNIQWLEVTVDDAFRVDVGETLGNLKHNVLDMVRRNRLRVLNDDVPKVLSAVLHNHIQVIEVLRISGPHDGFNLDDLYKFN